ncbi:hypothetical protein [Roseicyclus persicicus]|uniref:Uncharacterized protein n=1 Tax=Roseicyclus persicicus TaxID=2650661 RepID=A0A7X6K0H0_9RHOB|nr:hypothetical protein [Roseibacterium persicicum]NKX46270.1 hypothetical protein [Roseibacterium persicicum]
MVLVGVALTIAAAGYWIDRVWGGDAFPRAGALIVAFGAAFAGLEVYGMERAIMRHEARVEKLEAAYLDAAKEGRETTAAAAFSRLAENLSEYRNARIERVGRMIRAEIAILCFGTLIWGFGDLVV